MKRISWLLLVPLGFVGFAAAAVPVACVEFDTYELDPNGNAGGMGTTSSTSSMMMTSGGGMGGSGGSECTKPEDCANYECKVRACADNKCVWTNEPENTPLQSQLYGDCNDRVCDGMGGVKLVPTDPATDGYDWGNPCYKKACNATAMEEANNGVDCMTAWGKPGKCNSFECWECPDFTDCGTNACVNHRCVVDTCNNMTTDANETGQDCGGPDCQPCGPGSSCNVNGDCNGTCDASDDASVMCVEPSCTDGVQNNDETDIDCGGTCAAMDPLKKCPDPKKCLEPKDCLSGVCQVGECKPASCFDQVKNQDETDIDCGGMKCSNACP